MMNEPKYVGKVPSNLMDAFTRQHRLTDRAFGKIGEFLITFALRRGYDVLMDRDGVEVFEDDNLFAFFVRKKTCKDSGGFLIVDDDGHIIFVQMSKGGGHGSWMDVLYG